MNALPRCFVIDTCVWLDFLIPTRAGNAVADRLLALIRKHGLGIYCPPGIIQNLSYLAEALMKRELKGCGAQDGEAIAQVARQFAWSCVQNTRKIAAIVGVDESDVWFAEKYHRVHPDFEDDLVLAAARRCEADYLVTNDKALISHATVSGLTSEDAVRLLESLYEE